ncbi:hydrogenase maturation nickel metallochaperone HypA [bacterium]|nr:hydrogenase maturation nickel metallochaperone HypA [bacterium]
MHEMAIAVSLYDQVCRAVEAEGEIRVEEVEVRVGDLQLVVPEAFEAAWDAVCQGTGLEGSRLKIVEVPPRARCRGCDEEFRPEVDFYLCPQCGEADVDILEGREIILSSLTAERVEG